MKLPNLFEAIQGKLKIKPVWKKSGSSWTELTEYPKENVEPIGNGHEHKH